MVSVATGGIGMNITLYVIVPNGFTLFFNVNDNTPQLFNGNGKVNREVLGRKREEIYGQRCLLSANPNIARIPSIEDCLVRFHGIKQ